MKVRLNPRKASAVIAVLALLGILSLYVLANARTLVRLKHDVKQIEQRQLQRLRGNETTDPAQLTLTTNPVQSVPDPLPSPASAVK